MQVSTVLWEFTERRQDGAFLGQFQAQSGFTPRLHPIPTARRGRDLSE